MPRAKKYDEKAGLRPSFFIHAAQHAGTPPSKSGDTCRGQDQELYGSGAESTFSNSPYGPPSDNLSPTEPLDGREYTDDDRAEEQGIRHAAYESYHYSYPPR